MGWRDRLLEAVFGDLVEQRVQQAVKVVDDRWWTQVGGRTNDRDFAAWQDNYKDALEAWRVNPLARRIVQLTTDYVVGGGIEYAVADTRLAAWVGGWWRHRQNRLDLRLTSMCDELTRAGELFPVLYPNPEDGMSYLRFRPANCISRIETAAEDYENELEYVEILGWNGEERRWKGLNHPELRPDEPVMLHYAINRPLGAVRGDSDLATVLVWLRRYRAWLEGRVRINEFKSAFVYDVEVPENAVASAKQRYSSPPAPGSIIVHGPGEKWTATQPNIGADDAEADGKALRQMIAVGGGVPPHYLSDAESATQATAREANAPTLRHYEQRQKLFSAMLGDLVTVAVMRAQAMGRPGTPRRPHITSSCDLGIRWMMPDLNPTDNLELARSALAMVNAAVKMRQQGWGTDEELAALVWKFAGEILPPEDIAARITEPRPPE